MFLDVERGAGTHPWTTAEDTAPGWTYQGYSPLADPGASGEASHVSESQGAYGQLTVAGSELQIVGWRGPDGGTLELFVDGVSRGTAQQQSPTETFSAVLFSVSALSPGDHLVRLQQVSPTGAGWTQIDVVRSR